MPPKTLHTVPQAIPSHTDSLRDESMPEACNIADMDKALVTLFQAMVQDPTADLCAVLSTRRRAIRYMAKTVDGHFDITLTPDSPNQRLFVTLRHGDVFYELTRRFGQDAPYGGLYQGIKFYAEIGAVPLADKHVEQLLQQWNQLFANKPVTHWERFLQLLSTP